MLLGDSDVNGDSLSVTGFTQPSGLATVTDFVGSVTYDPNGKYESLDSGESALDTFTYTLSDGITTDTGTVSVTVNGANDAPLATADGSSGFGSGHVSVNSAARAKFCNAGPCSRCLIWAIAMLFNAPG